MPQGLVKTEPNLVWIFRGDIHMKLFIRHILKVVPLVKIKEIKFSYEKESEKLRLGAQSSDLPI